MSYKETIDIKSSLNFNFTILKIFGLWVPRTYRGTFKEHLYKIYATFSLGFWFYAYFLSETINFFLVLGDVDAMVEASFLWLTHAVQSIRMFNTLYRHERIQMLVNRLDEPIFNLVDVQSHHRVRASMTIAKRTSMGFVSLVAVTCLTWAVFPLIETSDEYRLPFPAWCPFDIQKPTTYKLVFAYQIVSTLINAVTNITQETITSGVMMLACGQLDVLYDKLSDKHHRQPQDYPKKKLENGDQIYETNSKHSKGKHLSDCLKHHVAIISFIEEIEDLLSFAVLVHFGAGCLIICITAFKMSMLSFSAELISYVLYLICMLVQIYLYCNRGHRIIVKSELINDAAYCSEWYSYSQEEKKLLFMIMERTKRPLCVKAGIFTLSHGTFTAILRSSYSYFAVLRQRHQYD